MISFVFLFLKFYAHCLLHRMGYKCVRNLPVRVGLSLVSGTCIEWFSTRMCSNLCTNVFHFTSLLPFWSKMYCSSSVKWQNHMWKWSLLVICMQEVFFGIVVRTKLQKLKDMSVPSLHFQLGSSWWSNINTSLGTCYNCIRRFEQLILQVLIINLVRHC